MREISTAKGLIIRKYSKNFDYDCKCGGDIFFDGEGGSTVPIGMGFVNEVFGVTKIHYKGWVGECIKCRKPVMAWITRKVIHEPIELAKAV